MDPKKLSTLVMDALACAMSNNPAGATDALTEIDNSGDPFDMYAACCAFARVGKTALTKIYGERSADLSGGDMWTLHDLTPGAPNDPAETFANRFLVAHCNDDKDMAPALYRTALEAAGEQYVDSVCALLANVAGLYRLAVAKTA